MISEIGMFFNSRNKYVKYDLAAIFHKDFITGDDRKTILNFYGICSKDGI